MITSNNVKSNIGICICGNQGTCEDKKLDRPRNGTIRNCNVRNYGCNTCREVTISYNTSVIDKSFTTA